jgi:hypothetical protein
MEAYSLDLSSSFALFAGDPVGGAGNPVEPVKLNRIFESAR